MKKILIILLTIPLIFGSCEKEDDTPDSNSNNGNPITPSLGLIGYGNYDNDVYKTTDGGVTWNLVSTSNVYELSFPSDNIGYGNYDNDVYKTTDGGVTWNLVSTSNVYELSFPSDNIGYGNYDNDVYKTTNGGVTWNLVSTSNVYKLSFP